MSARKTIIFLPDGAADEPIASLGNKTPLQAARTPAMDSIARDGASGTLLTLPEGFPTSSDVANMSVLGCDLATEACGRGPLEAAGHGIPMDPQDYAFRLNLTTQSDGFLRDFSGGRATQETAEGLIACLQKAFGGPGIRFHTGVSYRNILLLAGPAFNDKLIAEKPDDNQGSIVAEHLPRASSPEGEKTAAFLRRLIAEAPAVLAADPINRRLAAEGKSMANGVWPWSGGRAGALRPLREKYGIESSAVISAVDVIRGLGRCLGMDMLDVPGATGYVDTNYEGKAQAAIAALRTHDFVYVHVEGIDEVSHEQNLKLKLQAIEDFDARIVGPVLAAVGPNVNVAVLPDHPVPLSIGKHTRIPVPASVRMVGLKPDGVQTFDEVACKSGSLGAMANGDLMALLFGKPRGS
ncbi:MAG: cofactor-independent phosphoglycerate mutase [Verrucomicrobia bacterium]|nr:cofactor-independent phosphoglycerate mutase [Verrucomicrobiota bacterium]